MFRKVLLALVTFALLAAGGALAWDNPPEQEHGNDDHKITICHIPPGNPGNAHTIEIDESAWPAHEAHGDYKGECQGEPTTTGDDEECEPVDGVIPEECEGDEEPCPEGQEGNTEDGCVIPPVVTTGETDTTPPEVDTPTIECPAGFEFDDIYGDCVETSPPPDAAPPVSDEPVPPVNNNECKPGYTFFQGKCYPRGVAGKG